MINGWKLRRFEESPQGEREFKKAEALLMAKELEREG